MQTERGGPSKREGERERGRGRERGREDENREDLYSGGVLTGEHVVTEHPSQPHDPLVAVVGKVGNDGFRERLSSLDKRATQVVLVLLNIQCVLWALYGVGNGGGRVMGEG